MSDILKKLGRAELRRLEPGDWVAWSRSNWGQPGEKDFAYHEAQVMAHPVRTAQEVAVLFNGLPHAVQKNRLYKVLPVISVEDMHQQFDYNC
jgi:hypothetical protein